MVLKIKRVFQAEIKYFWEKDLPPKQQIDCIKTTSVE